MPCRFCSNITIQINDFGVMPIANSFSSTIDPNSYRFQLITAFCDSCKLFQLVEQPNKELMFHGNYPFFTGLSKTMTKHFHNMVVDNLTPVLASKDSHFVVEIGCNDGTLLEKVKELGFRHLGVDPSSNVIEKANAKGISAELNFFGENTAQNIAENHGKATIIFAANVICHLPDLKDLAKGIKELLAPEGIFIFEEPYAGSMLKLTSFDQFYDEHVYIFSLMSIRNIFESLGLELYDAIPQETHGGSMRYFIANSGRKTKTIRLQELLDDEIANGLDTLKAYENFETRCQKTKVSLKEILIELKQSNKTVGGYAATSKSTTVLNYCGIDSKLISFICDSTPEKVGKFAPGSNIPIISVEDMRKSPPDYLVLFGWNHEKEIMEKEKEINKSGVKWIKYIPEVRVVNS
jgi:methylation protein EvaC